MDETDDLSGPVDAATGSAELSILEGKVDVQEVLISDNVSSVIDLDKKDLMSALPSRKQDNGSESLLNLPDDDDDHLLAKAIFEIEIEIENEICYKRPLGKSYIKPKNVENEFLVPKPVDTCSPFTSVLSAASSVLSLDDSCLVPPVDFINLKRDFLLNLVSDSSYSSNDHLRSERIMAFIRSSSLNGFRTQVG